MISIATQNVRYRQWRTVMISPLLLHTQHRLIYVGAVELLSTQLQHLMNTESRTRKLNGGAKLRYPLLYDLPRVGFLKLMFRRFDGLQA